MTPPRIPKPAGRRPRRAGAGLIRAILAACLVLQGAPAGANPCDEAAREASRSSGVPLDVLQAVARTESGRTRGGAFAPWPWTVNVAGAGSWYDTRAEAAAAIARARAAGTRNVDIGCFQINFHWHGARFSGPDQMLDPSVNADYAAAFLARLRAELGTWEDAVGAFHSRTPRYRDRYLERYRRIHAALDPPGEAPRPVRLVPRALDLGARPALLPAGGDDPALPSGFGAARPLWETAR